MSEETERLKIELAVAQLKAREAERLDRAEARAKREARFEATEQRRRDRTAARSPEGKDATKRIALDQWTTERLAAGWRYVLAWGHEGPILILSEPPIPAAYHDRVTSKLTAAERAMTYDDFMEIVASQYLLP